MSLASTVSLPTSLPAFGSVWEANFASFQRNDHTVFLTPDNLGLDSQQGLTTSYLDVYAETITLVGAYDSSTWGGKHIGLHCNFLNLQGHVTIDVSGRKGNDGGAIGLDGSDGGDAGSIEIFVQDSLGTAAWDNLTLIANGGDGGNGMANVTAPGSGGVGGKAGKGGTITVQYGSNAARLGLAIGNAQKLRADKAVTTIQKDMQLRKPMWTSEGVDTASFLKLQSNKAPVAAALSLLGPLRMASAKGQPKAVRTAASTLLTQLNAMIKANSLPYFTPAAAGKVSSLRGVLDSWNYNGAASIDPTVTAATARKISAYKFPSAKGGNDTASMALADIRELLVTSYEQRKVDIEHQCSVTGGLPGLNATAGNTGPASMAVPRAKSGEIRVHGLKFDGSKGDVVYQSALMIPEQMQMVLNEADDDFFASDSGDASDSYTTILERLTVVDTSNTNPKLAAAWNAMESLSLTTQARSNLVRIRKTAAARLRSINKGADMFGRSPGWVPRMVYNYYQSQINTEVQNLIELQADLDAYKQKLFSNDEAQSIVNQFAGKIAAGKDQAQSTLNEYQGANGQLQKSAAVINSWNPILKQRHDQVSATLASLELTIQTDFNWDWNTALDAFASFAVMPSKLGGLAQLGATLFQFGTEVQDSDGTWIKKDNVVQKFTNSGNNTVDMVNAYSEGLNGQLTVDDAAFNKLTGAQSDLDSLVDQYTAAIGPKLTADFKQQMQDYVDAATARNQAVLQYNSAAETYRQALSDLDYYTQLSSQAGQLALTVDPTLPSTFASLQNRIRTTQLTVMQYLNWGARSLQYWGPQGQIPQFTGKPLEDSTDLTTGGSDLTSFFNLILTNYADHLLYSFPATQDAQGYFIKIDPGAIKKLKQKQSSSYLEGLQERYEMVFTIKPDLKSKDPILRRLSNSCNIRLGQVRVWLPGATVGGLNQNNDLSMSIVSMADETIIDTSGTKQKFSHDVVSYTFTYAANNVKNQTSCTTSMVTSDEILLSEQYSMDGSLPAVQTFAALGPFQTWKVVLTTASNHKLDLSKVKEGLFEVRGWGNTCS